MLIPCQYKEKEDATTYVDGWIINFHTDYKLTTNDRLDPDDLMGEPVAVVVNAASGELCTTSVYNVRMTLGQLALLRRMEGAE